MAGRGYLDMELLRFLTCGSVDDGKSTLIGRLLYDSKSIFDDQYEAIKLSSERRGEEQVNLALLTDGLRAEREQGITIDVAYRYFATPRRKFIIADCPGHVQYTRNMVTGASTANLAIILIDARKGVLEQTCRHAFIASLLQIPHVVVCVNKMDLVDYSEEVFEEIRAAFEDFAAKLDVTDFHFIPIAALHGDNIVERSRQMDWYQGPTLMYLLNNIHISNDQNHIDGRFPVQYVVRPQTGAYRDYRGYAGRVAGGIFRPGDQVVVLPSGMESRIKSIDTYEGPVEEAFPPMSVTLTLDDEIDISRGDMIVKENNRPLMGQEVTMMVCWLNDQPMKRERVYAVRHTTRDARCRVREVHYTVDVNTLHRREEAKTLGRNDIGKITIHTTTPLVFDKYSRNRNTGSLILIDEGTNETVAAGMIA